MMRKSDPDVPACLPACLSNCLPACLPARVLKKNPELVEEYIDRAASLLHDKNQGVALSGVTLMLAITGLEPAAVERYRAHVPVLCKMLRGLLQVGGCLCVVGERGAERMKEGQHHLSGGCLMSKWTCGCLLPQLQLKLCHTLFGVGAAADAAGRPAAAHLLLMLLCLRVGSTLSMMWAASVTPTCRSRSCSC
jgi:hypothetical protein